MAPRFGIAIGTVLLGSAVAWAQTKAIDLIPGEAVAAFALASPDDLKTKGDQLFKAAEFNPGFTPTTLVNDLVNFLGVRPGLDLRGTFALSFLPAEGADAGQIGTVLYNFVLALPVTDRDQMAGNFGFAKGELVEGRVLPMKQPVKDLVKFAAVRGGHVFLGNRDTALRRALQARPLSGLLSPVQREAFARSDLLFHFNPRPLNNEWGTFRRELDKELDRWHDPQDRKTIELVSKSLDHFRFVLMGARVDKGLGFDVFVSLDEAAAPVKELLASLRSAEPAHVNGLPAGRVVATTAHAGAGARSGLFVRVFGHYFLRHLLETKRLTSVADRPMFLDVFNEVWDRLHGSRAAVYLTRDESRLGLFSVAAILDTADAPQFLADVRSLAKMADGTLDLAKPEARQEVDIPRLVRDLGHDRYAIRNSANTKLRLIGDPALPELEKAVAAGGDPERVQRAKMLIADINAVAAERRKELLATDVNKFVRPTFAWVARAETRLGQPVDIVQVKLKEADQAAAQKMKQYFGPDWDKIRVAVRGRQVVVLLGSEVDLFEQTLKNLQGASPVSGAAANDKGNQPISRLQVSLATLSALVSGQPLRAPSAGLTSTALSIPDTGVQIEVQVPVSDVGVVLRSWFW